jgi:hypothetical protein
MLDIFSFVPLRMKDVSGGYLSAQVQINEKDLFTGLFHLDSGEEQDVLFFWQGRMLAFYRLERNSWMPVPFSEWNQAIAASRGDLRVLPLPVAGLRLYRLLLESDFSNLPAPVQVKASELHHLLSVSGSGDLPSLAFIRREDAAAALLLSADNNVATDGVLVSASGALAGLGVLNQIRSWGERVCQVWRGRPALSSDGWMELQVGSSFSLLVGDLLARYEELAGRFLTSYLTQQINSECDARRWAISFYSRSISNQHYFDTSENAGRAYAILLDAMYKEMSAIVGAKMSMRILQEAIDRLPETARRALLEQALLYSSYLAGNMGAVNVR